LGSGTLSGSLAWLEGLPLLGNPAVIDAFARPSPIVDAFCASLLRSQERAVDLDRLLVRTPPIILTVGRSRAIRLGWFDWTTDRDAFISELLGRPIPKTPRYAPSGPLLPVAFRSDLQSLEEALGMDPLTASWFYRRSRNEAAPELGRLGPLLASVAGGDDQASGDAVRAVVEADPEGFARSPYGRMFFGLVRGAPRWRQPGVDHELALTFDLGIAGRFGLAMWLPGPSELRRHRRQMAAHLRFRFDFRVAPHGRWSDGRTQREALFVWWRTIWPVTSEEPRPQLLQIGRGLRGRYAVDYACEGEEVTLRRIYRLSVGLSAPSRPRR
jgi:hypothetical protein